MKKIFLHACVLIGGAPLVMAEIVINEIHYDPEPKTEMVEFIELFHSGEESADLSGWTFTSGFDYVFPEGSILEPGEYLVLAQNEDAYNLKFSSIFVGGKRAFGQFLGGRLSNDGEAVTLENASGEVMDVVEYSAHFPWPTAAQGERVSMELIHPGLDNDLAGSWRASIEKPSPGLRNTVYLELDKVPPQGRQVAHEPHQAVSGEDVRVSVKVTDPDGVASVNLNVQWVLPGEYVRVTDDAYENGWEALQMRDDGESGDLIAGDDVYSVIIPGARNDHRVLVRYRLLLEDTVGNSVTLPYEDDPQPNFAYFVYDGVPQWSGSIRPGQAPVEVFSEEVMRSVPAYHLIANNQDVENQQWNQGSLEREFRGTLVFDGDVYDHMIFTTRGQASTYQVGKNKWDLKFLRGHHFQAKDNYGNAYPVTWQEINVLPGTNPWWGDNISTDGTILNEPVGFRLYQLAGGYASNTNYFQLRIIDDQAEATSNQYEGDLWGLYVAIQDPDGTFLDERGLPDGNVYNLKGGEYGHKNQGATQVSDQSDVRTFNGGGADGFNRTQSLEWWQEHFNFDAYFAFNAGNLAINNSDMRPGWNMMLYHHPEGQWYTIPWDLDLTFEEAPHLGRGDTEDWENYHRVLDEHPEVDAAYQSRVRELLGLLLSDDQSGMLIGEYANFIWQDGAEGEKLQVSSVDKSGEVVSVTTSAAHGFETGDTVTVEGAEVVAYNGSKIVTRISDTEFSYKVNIFTSDNTDGNWFVYRSSGELPLVKMDQAMWDHHPRKVKKGIYYRNISSIPSPDFEGYVQYMKDFLAPGGYGHELLKSHVNDLVAPDTPTITYVGDETFPVTGLRFSVSEFSGGSIFAPQAFSALQWRIAETTDPGRAGFNPDEPRVYEVNPLWQSEEITTFESEVTIPAEVVRPNKTYRVRARMKNLGGHWSYWSDPVQFIPDAGAVGPYLNHFLLTEMMYHPREATEAELAAGFDGEDFEFIEFRNIGDDPLDLSLVQFDSGIDFSFEDSAITSLEPGAFVVVVSNLQAFEMRYGQDLPVAGEYIGSQLSNSGERLTVTVDGVPVRDFTYQDGGDSWVNDADGNGYSLSLAEESADLDLNDGGSWKRSQEIDGSPGTADTGSTGETSIGGWLEGYFTEEERSDPEIAGLDADPDGDEWANLFEYAFAGNPLVKDNLNPEIALAGEAGSVTLRYGHQADAADLTYEIQHSVDLEQWLPMEPKSSESEVIGGRTFRISHFDVGSGGFLRVRVELSSN